MKTKEQLYQRESEIPHVALKANSQCESQDLPSQEARSSWETQRDAQSFRETGCNIVDYRVPGNSMSTVQQQDEQRQLSVAKLIEKFESHQYKEQFLKDMSQTQKINRFSEASQKLLQDMDQTEIFELCENSTKLQCSDGNAFSEVGIIIAVAGEIWSTIEVLQHFKRTASVFFRSLATSLRRIPVDYQSMINLRDKLFSSRRKTCYKKQTRRIIRQFFPDGEQNKATEAHWRSTILVRKTFFFTNKLLSRNTIKQQRKLKE